MRLHLALSLALALCIGCQPLPNTAANGTKRQPGRTTPAADAQTGDGQASNNQGSLERQPLNDPTRTIAQVGAPATLIGKVKLISDKGVGVISNNSGNLISNNGGALVSGSGGSYRTLADAPLGESLLAEATVEVLDAAGKLLIDPAGKPLTAVTDGQGGYKLSAVLPDENLVLRIRLFPQQGDGGQLVAFRPKQSATDATFDLDTASTLGTRYVLDRYVKQRPEILDRLPASEAQALKREMDAAKALWSKQAPSYKPDDMVAAAENLRHQVPALDKTLERIEAILLAGQKDLGNGLKATQVPLATPLGVVGDAAGNLYIAESAASRLRKVAPDGTITTFAGPGAAISNAQGNLGGINNLIRAADGSLYFTEAFSNRVQRITPAGKLEPVAGDTYRRQGALGGAATATSLVIPAGLALGPDGKILIGEVPDWEVSNLKGRLLQVDAQGLMTELDLPSSWNMRRLVGLAIAPDGTLFVQDAASDQVARKKPGGSWELPWQNTSMGFFPYSRMWLEADGSLIVSEGANHRLTRLLPDGTTQPVAGNGRPGYSGDGGPATSAQLTEPAGMWRAPDGTLYVCDSGNGLVRAIDKNGIIRTVAGTMAMQQTGDALSLPINQPAAVTVDSQGRIVFAELSSCTIKRLENQQLSVLAGTTKGFAGDGGSGKDAKFDTIAAIAYDGETLYLTDSENGRVRKLAPDGTISTIAGSGGQTWGGLAEQPALEARFGQLTGAAVAPDHTVYVADSDANVVCQITADGKVKVVAGAVDGTSGDSGDGGPAKDAKLSRPAGLLFDKAGNLYISDAGNLRVRRITPEGIIQPVAGLAGNAGLMQLFAGAPATEGGDAKQACLVAPSSMAFDAAGNLYVAEVGTFGLGLFAGAALPINQLPDIPARIRKITPDGKIFTVAGPPSKVLVDAANDNVLRMPIGLTFDQDGRLIVADSGTNQLKMLPKSSL